MKKTLIALCVVAVIAGVVVVATQWNVEAAGGARGQRWGHDPFAGAWSVPVPMVGLDADGNPVLLHISHHPMVVNPIDPQHRNYTVVVKHAHCDRTILGLVPDATFASDYIGAGSRTGRDTFKLTTVGYRSDCSTSTPLFDEPNYIEVMSADYELVDDNLMVGTGNTSIYCRSKDTNSDGLITEEDGDGVLPEPDLCLTFGGEMPFPLPYATRITVRDARCEMSFPVMPIDCGE